MAKNKRRGDRNPWSSQDWLPPAQEYVHRSTELDSGRSRTLSDVLSGVWGRAPIEAEGAARAWRPLANWLRTEAVLARYGLRPRKTYSLAKRSLRPVRPYAMLSKLQIRVPQKVRFCQKRKERKEVLFALNRAGFSGSAPKRHYRRAQESQYRC